ncbi:MOSC domain-containing protein [Campylobacter geochelonis]|uniref:MOSC domain-containing protein n=1 Tax=Campylobacter geochelonis TaxID=1780362 RepID=UPI0007708459|nr:MOSC domain-containing protein [Campylobacter geochelonis]CZE49430.1 mosc domain-containing protein [Campylobacter geochelonis]
MAKILFLGVGKIQKYGKENYINLLEKPWQSAMKKVAFQGEVYANELGFINDSVADTKNHGGIEKAIFANSAKNYKIWENFLETKMEFGDMGENLSIDELDENSVCVGDIHKIGSLVLQVSQPRKPCFKISKFFNNAKFTAEIFKTGRTGWYYRVVENGSCKCGDEVEMVQKDSANLSIMELNQLFYAPKEHLELLEKFKKLKTIKNGWDKSIQERILGIYDNEYMRSL